MNFLEHVMGFFEESQVPKEERCGVIYLSPVPVPEEELPLVKELYSRLCSYGRGVELINTFVPCSPRRDIEEPPFGPLVRPGQIMIVRPTPSQTDPVTFRMGLSEIVREYDGQYKGGKLKKTQVHFYEATAFP